MNEGTKIKTGFIRDGRKLTMDLLLQNLQWIFFAHFRGQGRNNCLETGKEARRAFCTGIG